MGFLVWGLEFRAGFRVWGLKVQGFVFKFLLLGLGYWVLNLGPSNLGNLKKAMGYVIWLPH